MKGAKKIIQDHIDNQDKMSFVYLNASQNKGERRTIPLQLWSEKYFLSKKWLLKGYDLDHEELVIYDVEKIIKIHEKA